MSTASFLQRTGAFAAILGQFGWGSAVVYAQDLDVSVVPVYDEWELPAGTSDAMLTFEFTNRGRDAVRLDFTCSGSMGLRCRDRDLGSATLSVGASEVIRAYLDAPLQETAGVVQVLATYRGQPVAEGAYAIRVTAAGESTSQGPEVTPKGGELEAPIGAISEIEFHVRNPGLARATYELKCMVSPPVEGGCEIDENSTVDPESTAAAPARFTPDSNTTYQVTVTAAGAGGEDTGWVAVSTTGVVGPQESPTLTLDDANPGLEEERHDCPKIRAGAGSIECDDYRYDFSLGSLLRMNQARAFSLSYSSGTASPSRIIGANLTLPHTAGVEEVRAMLWVQGELQDSVVLGGEVALGVPVRLALQVTRPPSSGNTIVPYRVSATVRYSGGSTADTLSASSYYIQLDRGADRGEFGTGWWLSGYERLTPINDSDLGDVLLWSDSDGNARAYLPEPGEPGLWIARTRGRPQTILTAAQPVADEARYLDLSAFEWASTDGRPTKGLDGGSAMTWAFWVNASRSPAQFAGLHDESWLPRVWWFDITPAGLRVALQAAETGTVSTAVAHLPWDEWAFVIVQYDGAQDSTEGRLRAWVNGEEAAVFFEGQVPSSLWAEPRVALGIGRSSPSPGLVGRLGELAILRTVLSEDDKADWYAHGIDFDREGLVSGFEWHESLRDIGPAGSDLTSHTIEVEDRDFVATSEYPSRKAPVGGWRRLANMAAYHRPLSGGGEELFDAAGRHIGTVDRHGNETRFEHRLIGTASRLTSILLPTPDGPKPALELQYDSATLALRAVRAVSGDGGWLGYQIAASPTGTGFQIDGIIAPDGLSSSLTYDAGHLVALTDHRGAVTELSYDRGKVTGVRITTPDEPDVDDIAMHYRPAALVGMDPDGMFAPEPADNVTSVFDGPRADVQDSTRYFVTGWGAIRGIEDAEGNITWIDRTDPHLPGLVTRVAYPNGRVVETSYDPVTGLATSNTDHADDVAVTEYEWDTRWDSPTLIRTAAGVERRFAYDPGTGDLDSTWVGSTVARFTYDERGLLGSWTLGADAGTSFAYDSLGNLAAQTSPLGLETRYSLDQLGRVVEVRTPIALGNEAGDRIESYTYDLAGRPVLHRLANTVDDAMAWDSASYDHRGDRAATYRGGTASSRAVESFPGLERSSLPAAPLPPLTWTHDQLGRVTTVSIGGASREALQYDLAGNVTRRRTSAGDTIWLEYDRLNRLVKRRTSDRAYGPASEIVGAPDDLLSWPFPYYPTYGSDLVVPGDEALFEYDELGHLIRATNPVGTVTREFTLRGELATDGFLPAAAPDATGTEIAETSVTFQYDQDGRVTEVGYPEEGNGESEVATYFYQEGADRLASVLDPLGYATSYRYDRADRTAGIVHPGDLVESIEYDTDGRVEQLDLGALVSHSIVRGPDGNVLRVARNLSGGDKVQVERTYDGLGHVTSTVHFAKSGALAERLVTDGRGRLMLRGTMSSDGRSDVRDAVVASHYDPETGALFEQSTDWPLLASDAGDYPRFVEVTYEPGGAISTVGTRSYRSDAHGTLHPPVWMTASAEHNYYDANGRLRYRQQLGILREPDPLRVERVFGAWEEYLYDALGRRVMVRSISGGLCDNPSCYSAERSYAWGGDRIYFERSVPVDGADLIEGQYGSVLYTYGTDSRHPASVVRRDESGVAQAIFPHADWRGRIAMVTDSAGRRCDLGKRGCAGAVWPADLEDEFGAVAADAPLGTWFGSLLDGQRGMTGLLYSNGGHYDPRLGTDVERDVPGPDANDTWGAEWAPRWLTSWEDMGVPGAPRPLLQAVETLPSARGCIGDQCPAHAPTELRTR